MDIEAVQRNLSLIVTISAPSYALAVLITLFLFLSVRASDLGSSRCQTRALTAMSNVPLNLVTSRYLP